MMESAIHQERWPAEPHATSPNLAESLGGASWGIDILTFFSSHSPNSCLYLPLATLPWKAQAKGALNASPPLPQAQRNKEKLGPKTMSPFPPSPPL